MRAVRYHTFGGYDRLVVEEVADPEPAPDQVLVRVLAAGVSPLDDKARAGVLADGLVKPLPLVPGASGAGEVVDPGGSSWTVGSQVLISGWGFGTTRDGLWREYVAVAPDELIALPDGVDVVAAAGMAAGSGYLTAYLALTDLVGMQPGARVLAPGYAGAVGMATVEVATALGAGTVISTARNGDRARQAREVGLGEILDLSAESLRDGVARLTSGEGVDVVVDGIGGPLTGELVAGLASRGVLVAVGYSAGTTAGFDLTDLIWRTAQIKGFMFTLFPPERIRAANEALLDLVAGKELTPRVARVLPLDEAAEAQRHLVEDQPFGRVLLAPATSRVSR